MALCRRAERDLAAGLADLVALAALREDLVVRVVPAALLAPVALAAPAAPAARSDNRPDWNIRSIRHSGSEETDPLH